MMEHEQINDKCVALSMRGATMTSRVLAKAMQGFIKTCGKRGKNLPAKHGELSLKSLSKQGAALTDIEISGDNIGTFKKIARRYNIDFALKKDKSVDPPRWTVFFKAKDDKSLQAAFKEYTRVSLKQKPRKNPMLERLNKFRQLVKSAPAKIFERVKDKTKDFFR